LDGQIPQQFREERVAFRGANFERLPRGGTVAESPDQKQIPNTRERPVQSAAAFCREMIRQLGLELNIEGREENGITFINITGPDRSYLLTNSASLLNGLEYLLNRIFPVSKEEAPGVVLDSDQYRKHREAELILLAQMASTKVISMQKPLSLQPMIARERRIVHMALAGIEGVRSQSEGEGDHRSIVIYPA
jgi:spoIIIJ-associated protein